MNWAQLGILALQVVSTLVTLTVFFVIKFNDLKHLGKSVENIEKKIDIVDTRVDELAERVAKMEGKLS